LLGVMGAFVFAAQMINFPVGIGTTGHLVGGALLAFTLGPAAASVVMAAILTIQALVFQDGGILALGPNVVNMAILGVLAGYLPFYLWGGGPGGLNGRRRKFAIFAGGTLSVLVSAVLALSELMISGVKMPASVLSVSLGLFLVSGLLEGAITLAVIQALESIQPGFIRRPCRGALVRPGSGEHRRRAVGCGRRAVRFHRPRRNRETEPTDRHRVSGPDADLDPFERLRGDLSAFFLAQ